MLLKIVDTTMPVSNKASPSSMEVQVDLKQLSVISERAEPCRKIEIITPLNPLSDMGLKNWLNWLLLYFSQVLEIFLPFKRL